MKINLVVINLTLALLFFVQSFDFQKEIIGTWVTVKAYRNGIEFKTKEVREKYEMTFLENGRFVLDLRIELDKKKMGLNVPPTPYVWKTLKNKLIIEVASGHLLSGDSDQYLIFFKSDTLILVKEEFMFFHLRR